MAHNQADGPVHASIEKMDREGMRLIASLSHDAFSEYLRQTRNTICGRHPISVFLAAVEALRAGLEGPDARQPALEFTRYAQSSRALSQADSSVSYASAVFRV